MGRRAADRRAFPALVLACLITVAALWLALLHPDIRDAFATWVVAPSPGFVPGAVDALVAVVNGVRLASPFVTVVAVVAYLYFNLVGRSTARGRTLNRLSRIEYAGIDHLERDNGGRSRFLHGLRRFFSGTGLAILAVVLVGATSGIEHEVTNGPLRPVDALTDLLGQDTDLSYVFQSPGITFMDDSAIPADQMERLVSLSTAPVIPFGKHLFNLEDKSALEVSVPDELFEEVAEVEESTACSGRTVIVDDTVGADVGETVRLNGIRLKVVRVEDAIAQMNRSIAILSDSTMRECVVGNTNSAYFGALVLTDDLAAISDTLAFANIDAVAVSDQDFRENNRDFWRANATPLLLQLILYIALFSGFAAAGERQSSLQRNSREIGMLNATGVDFAALQAIERRRALRTTLKATVVAAPLMIPVAAAFNASELGVHIGVGLIEVSVGFSLTLVAMLLASQRALNQFRRTLDLPLAVKG